MAAALVLGTALSLAALAFVLYPLFFGTRTAARTRSASAEADPVTVLREIEFDRATGKLSDADYGALKATYSRAALEQMRAADAPNVVDAAELMIRRMSQRLACGTCGPRPEPDATWCSTCGGYLPGACERCGGDVREDGARFCSRCGERLAA